MMIEPPLYFWSIQFLVRGSVSRHVRTIFATLWISDELGYAPSSIKNTKDIHVVDCLEIIECEVDCRLND